jgi:hypothetical protein
LATTSLRILRPRVRRADEGTGVPDGSERTGEAGVGGCGVQEVAELVPAGAVGAFDPPVQLGDAVRQLKRQEDGTLLAFRFELRREFQATVELAGTDRERVAREERIEGLAARRELAPLPIVGPHQRLTMSTSVRCLGAILKLPVDDDLVDLHTVAPRRWRGDIRRCAGACVPRR